MNIYKMDYGIYNNIRDIMILDRKYHVYARVLDRWLSIHYGLTTMEIYEDNAYHYTVRDEEKLILFLLKWT